MYRIGIDVGGSFTDCVLLDEERGEVSLVKVPSTPQDPARGFMDGLETLCAEHEIDAAAIAALVHGTTVATNAIVEGRGAPAALLTTRGFRDVLEIGTQQRPRLYDLIQTKPASLIPRGWCFELDERIGPRGEVLQPLCRDEVRDVLSDAVEAGATSIAVCFLFSFANPVHEQLVVEVAREEFPDLAVSLSSEVSPEFREYVRASTTALNAAILPIVSRYLGEVEERIAAAGVRVPLQVMQSNGGVMSTAEARRTPVHLLSSGPAGGVIGGLFFGELAGYRDLITLDMGGTTSDVCLIRGGEPHVSPQGSIEGHPVRVPMIDIPSIGAGGGSIGWVDRWGMLKVGPRSAGADPGPACYGRGGTEPTVTDANLVLGRMDPASFLGGRMAIDPDLSVKAIEARVAKPLGMDLLRAAASIVAVANSTMLRLLRVVSVMRGYDPREFALVAFGGAGPVHACALAREVGIGTVVVPPNPGVCSAFGLLATDFKYTHTQTRPRDLAAVDLDDIARSFATLEERGRQRLSTAGVELGAAYPLRSMDLRYVGQQYDLNIPLPDGPLDLGRLQEIGDRFRTRHAQVYGQAAEDEPIEVVNLRVTTVGRISKPQPRSIASRDGVPLSPFTVRPVLFDVAAGPISCPIYRRSDLLAGDVLAGPCIVEQLDSTVVVEPGWEARVDGYGSIVITPERR